MHITNALIYRNHGFELGSISFEEKILSIQTGCPHACADSTIEGEANTASEPCTCPHPMPSKFVLTGTIDAGGCYLIPGLVDIHTHGGVGVDVSDGNADDLPLLSRYYASSGVTSWCPTTMTLKERELTQAVQTIRDFTRPQDGAKMAGIHLEGPFLSYEKRGAQAAENLHSPDTEMFHRLDEASGGNVRLITIAPEESGAIDFIKEISSKCTISLGHTTASYDIAMEAYSAGATHATHLYNGMPPLHHRNPSIIGAATDSGATVELICDGLHIHPSVVRLTHRIFADRLVLVSDSLRCAGMPDGDYTLGGQPITMKDGRATLTGTDTLAGSSIHLMDALRRAVSFGIPLEDAIYAATTAPADVIKRNDIGRIEVGCCSDFVLLDRDLNVKAVFIDGVSVLS